MAMSSFPYQPCSSKFYWREPMKSSVTLVFGNGDRKRLQLSDSSDEGCFTSVELSVGVHLYGFLVDGEWKTDPLNQLPLINGFNQIEVLPVLPACIPLSLKGSPLGHLFLQFSSSVLDEIVSLLHSRGLKGILISVILLDLDCPVSQPSKVNACALLRLANDKSQETQTAKDLNQFMQENAIAYEKYQLMVTKFQKNQPKQFEFGVISPTKKKMVITSDLPDYIIDQHIREHFGYLLSEIIEVKKCLTENKFYILFSTAKIASEAAAAYNNTVLKGNRIQVILEEAPYCEELSEDQPQYSSSHDFFCFDLEGTLITVPGAGFHRYDVATSLTEKPGQLVKAETDAKLYSLECTQAETCGIKSDKQEIKVFIYSKPAFSESVKKEHLMEHFREFNPTHAYVIKNKKTRKPSNTGVIVLSSRTMAEEAISKMRNSKILGRYSITLKPDETPLSGDKRKAFKSGKSTITSRTEVPQKSSGYHTQHKDRASIDTAKHSTHSSASILELPKETNGAEQAMEVGSVEIKVSHLARETTIKELRQFFERFGPLDGNPIFHARGRPPFAFVRFKSAESASKAASTKNPKLKGCYIKIKLLYKEVSNETVKIKHKVKENVTQTEMKSSKHPKSDTRIFTKTLTLELAVWNMLMTNRSKSVPMLSFSTLLEVIRSTYSSEDVTYEVVVEKSCLKIRGKQQVVLQFCEDIKAVSACGDLLVDGMIMKALVYLKSSLPVEIEKSFQVIISGFDCSSRQIQFFGHIESMQKAHKQVRELLAKLHKSEKELKLESPFPKAQLQLLQEKISPHCFIQLASHSDSVLIVYALESIDTEDIIRLANSMLSTTKELYLQPNQVNYLQHFWLPHQVDIPTRVTIVDGKVNLHGTPETVKTSEELLQLKLLPNVMCDSFSYSCKETFVLQIEKFVLDEIKNEDESFKSSCNYDSTGQKITVIISSKNQWFFCKASKELQKLEPQFKEFSVGLPPDVSLKKQLEQQHRTVINCMARDLVEIGGLTATDIEACHKELVDKLESTESKTESILISEYQYHYFETFHGKDMKELNEICKVNLSSSKEKNKYSIEMSGTVKQVKMVEGRLKSSILSQDIIVLPFTLSCPATLSSHWCNFWDEIGKKKKDTIPNFIMKYSHSHCESGLDFFNFDLIGKESERACIQGVKDLIYDDGDGTSAVGATVTFSDNGMSTFLKFRENQKLQFVSDSNVWILGVENTIVKLCAPMRLKDELNVTVAKLEKYILSNTATSEVIEFQDPVVQLVLSSKHCESYLKIAKHEAEIVGANVELSSSKNGTKSFVIFSSEFLISSCIVAVKKVTIEAIKKKIAKKMVEFESIFRPLIDSGSNFRETAEKLENEHCAVCCLEPDNVSLYVLNYQNIEGTEANTVKINIVRGSLTLEEADAIVHFTAEDLNFENDVSQLIAECAGPTVRTECSDYVHSVPWKLNIGDAVCLGAGYLPCKSVIHSILPNWSGENLEMKSLNATLFKILEIANDNSFSRISFPLGFSDSVGIEKMYAETLVEVLNDHHKELPSLSSLREITVVAKNDTSAHAFADVITSNISISVAEKSPKRHTRVCIRKPRFEWSWRNDHKLYLPYSSDQSTKLSLAFNNNPRGCCTIKVHSVPYTIDFNTMRQNNDLTQFKRTVKKKLVGFEEKPNETVEWKYQADNGMFESYSKLDSISLEEMYQGINENHTLFINSRKYKIDLKTMSQINPVTDFRRKIQRDAEKIKDEGEAMSRSFSISIRGLKEELLMAEKTLVDGMNSYIQSETMGNIPVELPEELKEEFERLASTHNVMAEWADSSDEDSCQTLTLRGVNFMVQETYIAIHKELAKFKSQEKPGQDYSLSRPSLWEPQTSDVEVFHVKEESDEWQDVERKFKATMPTHTVTNIQRIQNELVWKRYSLHKKYMEDKNKGIVNEMDLFHGSRENKPEDIYKGECGFDMRYSREGMWGHANYFAVNASYSHNYAYTGNRLHYLLRSVSSISYTRQIFLAKVLVGDFVKCASDRNLIMPPLKAGPTKKQYDSIKGHTNNSDVFMTYDNEKAYPAYLIFYE